MFFCLGPTSTKTFDHGVRGLLIVGLFDLPKLLATGHNCRIASVAALEGDAQYFIIWNISDHRLNFSINMIRFEKVAG